MRLNRSSGLIESISHVKLSDFGLRGSTKVYIAAGGRNVQDFELRNLTATVSEKVSAAFTIDAAGYEVAHVRFVNCHAIK